MNESNLSELLKSFKDPKVLIATVILTVGFVWVIFYLINSDALPSWKSIVPSKTTKEELIAKLGEPEKKQDTGGFAIFGYKSAVATRFDEIWIEKGTVVLVKEQISTKDKREFKDYERLSKGRVLYSNLFANSQALFVYVDKGIATLANQNTKDIIEIWYFAPTNPKNFMRFGDDLSTSRP